MRIKFLSYRDENKHFRRGAPPLRVPQARSILALESSPFPICGFVGDVDELHLEFLNVVDTFSLESLLCAFRTLDQSLPSSLLHFQFIGDVDELHLEFLTRVDPFSLESLLCAFHTLDLSFPFHLLHFQLVGSFKKLLLGFCQFSFYLKSAFYHTRSVQLCICYRSLYSVNLVLPLHFGFRSLTMTVAFSQILDQCPSTSLQARRKPSIRKKLAPFIFL